MHRELNGRASLISLIGTLELPVGDSRSIPEMLLLLPLCEDAADVLLRKDVKGEHMGTQELFAHLQGMLRWRISLCTAQTGMGAPRHQPVNIMLEVTAATHGLWQYERGPR